MRIVRDEKYPVILMGDFNCGTGELVPVYEVLLDTGKLFGSQMTYPYNKPTERIDYIFVSQSIKCRQFNILYSDASDHLPVLVDLELRRKNRE